MDHKDILGIEVVAFVSVVIIALVIMHDVGAQDTQKSFYES